MPAVEELPPEADEPVEALKESLGYLDSCIAQRNTLEAQLKQTSENVRLRPSLPPP
jgi:chaperonin cofactor prefoldin